MTEPRRTAGELMRYFAVSVIALGVDMGSLLLASQFLHYLWAATIGFALGAVVSYLLAIRWAFRHRRLAAFPRAEFAAYAAVGVAGLGINNLVKHTHCQHERECVWCLETTRFTKTNIPSPSTKLNYSATTHLWNAK